LQAASSPTPHHQRLEHFPAKSNPVSRKKMLSSSRLAHIPIAKPVLTFADYAPACVLHQARQDLPVPDMQAGIFITQA
jgi:hypothetical protein